MPTTLAGWIGTAAYLLVCLYAGLRKDRQVRMLALAVVIEEILYLAAWRRSAFFSDDLILLALDALLLVAVVAIAWRKPQPWLILGGGLQLLCTLAHPVRLIDVHVRERAMQTLLLVLGYAVLACLLWGAIEAHREEHRANQQQAALEADRAVWRMKNDVEAALIDATAGSAGLKGRELAAANAVIGELQRRRDALRPYRGDTATRMLYRLDGDR